MKILALDLGAKTGWCLWKDKSMIIQKIRSGYYGHPSTQPVFEGGVVEFKGDRHTRLRDFNSWLRAMMTDDLDIVAYERPFARGLHATRSLWGMAGITEAVGSRYAAVLDINVQTLKTWAGCDSKNKNGMMVKARELLGREPDDDNHADAVCLAHYVAENAEVGTDG